MKQKLYTAAVLLSLVICSCTHKDLCYDHSEHASRYHVNLLASFRLEWEEFCNAGGPDWKNQWPENYIPYDTLKPQKPSGLRVVNYNLAGQYDMHNISSDGGIVRLHEGYNDILVYNNDTEYIIFTRQDNGASTSAATRTRTRASYTGNEYANEGEETITPPDMLFSNYIKGYNAERVQIPEDINVTLHPLVFTYKIRYEFESGLNYVAMTRGALSGMARSVLMNTGTTSAESATLLYDCEMTDFGSRALVNSFGVPGYPNSNYLTKLGHKHALNLEVMLRNGNTLVYEFDVTDQVQSQPHGGVIVVKGIVVDDEIGQQGSGAFDVEVKGWGEYEDIIIPLT